MSLGFAPFSFEHFEEEESINNVGVAAANDNTGNNMENGLNNLPNNVSEEGEEEPDSGMNNGMNNGMNSGMNGGMNNSGSANLGDSPDDDLESMGGNDMESLNEPDNEVGAQVEEEELDLDEETDDEETDDEETDDEEVVVPEEPATTVSILPGVPTPNVPPHRMLNSVKQLLSLNNVLIFILILLVVALALTLKK